MNEGMQKSQDERFGEWQGKKNTSRAQRAKRWEDERHPGATVICRKSFEKQRAPFSQALYEILNSSNGLQTSRQEKCIVGDQLSWLDREVDASDAKKKEFIPIQEIFSCTLTIAAHVQPQTRWQPLPNFKAKDRSSDCLIQTKATLVPNLSNTSYCPKVCMLLPGTPGTIIALLFTFQEYAPNFPLKFIFFIFVLFYLQPISSVCHCAGWLDTAVALAGSNKAVAKMLSFTFKTQKVKAKNRLFNSKWTKMVQRWTVQSVFAVCQSVMTDYNLTQKFWTNSRKNLYSLQIF